MLKKSIIVEIQQVFVQILH